MQQLSQQLLPLTTLYSAFWLIVRQLTLTNNALWITFAPIDVITESYFRTTALGVNWLSMVYMALYIPLVFVAAYVVERRGLRFGMVVGSGLNALGAFVRYLATAPPWLFGHPTSTSFSAAKGGFAVLMTGQVIASVAQTFILGMPSRLAAVWFGAGERSTATGVAVLANQLGAAIACVSTLQGMLLLV